MNSFSTLNDYAITLPGQLLKLCSETPPGPERMRMARTLVKIWTRYNEDPKNNNPTPSREYYIDNCIWLTLPPR